MAVEKGATTNKSGTSKEPNADAFINIKIKSKDGNTHAIRGGAPLRSKYAADNALIKWVKENAVNGVVTLDPASVELEVRLAVNEETGEIEFVGF